MLIQVITRKSRQPFLSQILGNPEESVFAYHSAGFQIGVSDSGHVQCTVSIITLIVLVVSGQSTICKVVIRAPKRVVTRTARIGTAVIDASLPPSW